jgi:hypothetical protein
MQPPRALWVPFELGRPFGAPNEPEFQTTVLRAALQLLERRDGPPILEDFPEEAPVPERDSESVWACPVSFVPNHQDQPERLQPVLTEIEQLKPWHEVYVESRGKAAPSVSGLELPQTVRLLADLADGNLEPETESDLELREVIRLGCDDLRTWYSEAAQGQPVRETHKQIEDWFWTETAVAHLIAAAAKGLEHHADRFMRALAERVMVPRIYQKHLFSALR